MIGECKAPAMYYNSLPWPRNLLRADLQLAGQKKQDKNLLNMFSEAHKRYSSSKQNDSENEVGPEVNCELRLFDRLFCHSWKMKPYFIIKIRYLKINKLNF